jgi:hypothetical protein
MITIWTVIEINKSGRVRSNYDDTHFVFVVFRITIILTYTFARNISYCRQVSIFVKIFPIYLAHNHIGNTVQYNTVQ